MAERLSWCSKSHVGLKRRKNEDCFLVPNGCLEGPWGTLFAVADGMGGHPKGEVASRIACQVLEEVFYHPPWYRCIPLWGRRTPTVADLSRRLKDAFEEADKKICMASHGDQGERGMGTTLSALLIQPPKAVLAHVGDSRIYLFREGSLHQLTRDDTFINELVESGDITVEQARRNPLRHVLEQAIGQGFEGVFTTSVEMEVGDRFLLCTDGLHDMVTDEVIEDIVGQDIGVDPLCQGLVDAALAAGGSDNVTVVLVEWKG